MPTAAKQYDRLKGNTQMKKFGSLPGSIKKDFTNVRRFLDITSTHTPEGRDGVVVMWKVTLGPQRLGRFQMGEEPYVS